MSHKILKNPKFLCLINYFKLELTDKNLLFFELSETFSNDFYVLTIAVYEQI